VDGFVREVIHDDKWLSLLGSAKLRLGGEAAKGF
jgi:hypothetical protein